MQNSSLNSTLNNTNTSNFIDKIINYTDTIPGNLSNKSSNSI
jgi:hypothetical protein